MSILSKEKINSIFDNLKSNNKHIFSNIYLNDWWIDKMLENIDYDYKENQYINVYVDNGNFVKLYFAISDLQNYSINTNKTISIDYYNLEENDIMSNFLINMGFTQYSKYYKWINKSKTIPYKNVPIPNNFQFFEDVNIFNKETFSIIEKSFDRLSDDNIYINLQKMKLHSYAIKHNDKIVALLLYDINEHNYHERFICVENDYKKQNLATYLLNKLINKSHIANNNLFSIAWINNDNIASIKLHEKCNFKKTKTNKITFVKEKYGRKT